MKNNTNNEVKKMEATVKDNNGTVIVEKTPNVSRETFDSYVEQIGTIYSNSRRSALELARLYTEVEERKVLDYVSNDDKDTTRYSNVKDFARDLFGMELSDKQLNTYRRVVHKFGTRLEDGSYTIEPIFYLYGVEKLDIIGRSEKVKTKDSFNDFVNALGVYPEMSRQAIIDVVNQSNGKAIEDKKTKDDKPKDKTPKDNIKVEETEQYKEVVAKVESATSEISLLKQALVDIYLLAKDDKSKLAKDIVERYLKVEQEVKTINK